MESYEDVPCAIVPFFEKKFFWYKSLLLLSSFCWPFSLQKMLKYSDSGSRVLRITPFLRQKWTIWTKQIFLGRNYYNLFQLPISSFHSAKFKKNSSSRSRVKRMRYFGAKNGLFSETKMWFRKPVNDPCVYYSGLSTCQKSKSDINLLLKYWRLKNTEN